ncbi:hypothetical protein [Mesorhizobium sp. B2-3-15]|uniref:hypothetical protein n=1 Tax=Mesorhizobium sp. B2-3-15 TaxID=2589949 RepID=UPI0015E2CEC9|nr:hypothetical protein [Mesorhizobium sp. B2-3-15]
MRASNAAVAASRFHRQTLIRWFSMADLAAAGIASLALARSPASGAGWLVPGTCGSILAGLGVALVNHRI